MNCVGASMRVGGAYRICFVAFKQKGDLGMDNKLLNYAQASDFLGIPVGSLRNMVMRRQLPHVKIGRRVRFRARDLENWLSDNTIDVAS